MAEEKVKEELEKLQRTEREEMLGKAANVLETPARKTWRRLFEKVEKQDTRQLTSRVKMKKTQTRNIMP